MFKIQIPVIKFQIPKYGVQIFIKNKAFLQTAFWQDLDFAISQFGISFITVLINKKNITCIINKCTAKRLCFRKGKS